MLHDELPPKRLCDQHARLAPRMREVALVAQGSDLARARVPARAAVTAVENVAVQWVLDRPDLDRDTVLDEIDTLVGS